MSALTRDHIVGLILAGGQSRRMGGGDKGLLPFGHGTMLAHVAGRLVTQVNSIVLNANGDPSRFSSLGLPVARDTIEGFPGPLAGVLSGLRWAAQNAPEATHVVSVSADAPFLPADLVVRLTAAAASHPTSIALARSGGELHPVIGLWPVALAADLELELRAGIRKVLRWTDKHGTIPVDFDFIELANERIDPFFNANTPEELDEARRLLELMPA